MGTTALDVDSRERAPPPEEGALDIAQYTLQQLRRDAELVLFRGLRSGHEEGSRSSILVQVPVANPPSSATVRSLQEDYALRSELDPAYVVRSLSMVQDHGCPMVILEDPLGTPLDLLLTGAMDVAQFLRLAIRVAAALGHVHSRGLVHKDIKPANILVNAALTQAWLMGLGMASRLPRERQSGQFTEYLVGTLAYMAPEQTGRMNRSIDSRSDLYSLGVSFYEMLTGTLPFTASDPMELVHCHIARQPTPPCEKVNGVPRAVSAIIMKLLTKTAEERYQTAAGVESDLRRCLTEWETQRRIDEFALGEHDTPDRLLIPEKLYGRESEIDTLLAAFDRVVAGGRPELVLVSGYSGIGKSSVVHELHKALVPPRGLFASGKFDQYKRDIPYSTLAQAFQSLVRPLLSRSEGELSSWRDALHDALGPNGRLIVNLVPELQLIIGEPPPVPDLPLQDAQRRFQLVLRRFIGVFASPEHPLALFLDDLQWLDSATLDWIEDLLTQSDVRQLMLIGAYRDNEVDSFHPLRAKLDAIRKAGAPVQEIVLAPLTRDDLAGLITDSLHCESERATGLAALIHEKTAGNPFFAIQFISALAEEGLVAFDYAAGRWSWDLNRIRAKGYTDNVVNLMVGKLNRLPIETQRALQLLGCLGNSAEFALLEMVSQQSGEELNGQLWEAIRAGLILRTDQSYKFLHDRVQEAAYSLLPEAVRAETHLRIGRLLAACISPEKREEAIFEIVNQLNRGSHLIKSAEERKRFAELNLIAGRRAKSSTAYISALAYLRAGRALLAEESWEEEYELIFAIESHMAECELLSADMAAAENRLLMLAQRAKRARDIALVTGLRVTLYTILDQSDRGVEVALEYLRNGGTDWSMHPTREEVVREYDRIWSQLGSRKVEELLDLPLMTDPNVLYTMDVLNEIIVPAHYCDHNLPPLIICRMVNLSLEYGNSDGSCVAYLGLAMIAGPLFGNYSSTVLRFGQLGYDLVEQRGLKRFRARVYAVFGNIVMPWTRHVRAGRDLIRRAFDAANEMGDLTWAASRSLLVGNLLASGEQLAEVQHEAVGSLAFPRKARFGLVIDIVTTQLALIRTLRGLTPKFGCLDDGDMDEPQMERHLSSNPVLAMAACWYWVRKLQARYLAGDHTAAMDASSKAQRLLWTSPSRWETAEFCFYGALSHAASWDSGPPDQKLRHFEALSAHHNQLDIWARNCPENFENRAALVGAEIARIEGRELDAERLYEQAIGSARANGFIHNEALAYELAGRFYAARGFEEFARVYLRRARESYLRWGAVGKARQLEELHPHLLEQERLPTSAIGAPVEHLDLATVIKVSQAVSGEMVLEKLIDTLMRTAIEHAGAERGLLILSRDGEQRIAADATTSGNTVVVRVLDERVSSAVLPESVLHYVMRTQESVILDDASAQNAFSVDPYIGGHHARSVLCLPLSNRGKLIGVLYLENNLAPHVFAPARITVLKLLASQAAMSLENTRLYRDLTRREAKIRRLVDADIVGIFIWDLDGTILEANDALLRMVGYEHEDLVAGRLRWTDLTAAQWLGRDRQDRVAEIQRSGSLQPFEWEYIRKDGSRVPVLIGAASFEGEDQGVAFVLDLTERKRAEQALRQSEAYLAEAQRLTHTGSWAFDPVTGKVTYWSEEMFRIHGMGARRNSPPTYDEQIRLTHPEDRVPIREAFEIAIRDRAEVSLDSRKVMADGTVKYLHTIGHPVLDKTGALVEYVGTVVDVTERKRAEQRLLAQYRVTRILADAVTVEEMMPKVLQAMCECLGWDLGAVWRIDPKAGVLRCAQLWRTSTVEAAQFEVVTRKSTFRSGSGLPGRVWETGAPAYIPDIGHDVAFRRVDIAARQVLRAAIAFPILLGCDVLGVIGFISRDVSQPDHDVLVMLANIGSQIGQFSRRTAAVDELQLRVGMLQNIPVAAWSVMPDGTPDIVNQLWYEYTGQTPEYVNSHPEAWMATLHPEDRERASRSYWEGIRSGRGFTMEARFLRARDGTYRWHLNRAVPVRDAEGNILRFVGTSTDVHDWRQAQEALRNTQTEFAHMTRVMTMGELTASIAHEVNQPLGAIVTSAAAGTRWLATKPPQMDKARRALERIANDGKRAAEVIRRIRALMKRQAPRKEWLDINETILEVIALAQYQLRRSEVQLETRLGRDLPLVRGDRVQLQQVLLNLIINAVEAMSGIKERPRELTIVSASDGPDTVSVEVRDSGTGLAPEHAPHLFEPFYTTKAEGLGIGLSISRSIVEAHGGRLSAAANAPHGTVFLFSLPVNEPAP